MFLVLPEAQGGLRKTVVRLRLPFCIGLIFDAILEMARATNSPVFGHSAKGFETVR